MPRLEGSWRDTGALQGGVQCGWSPGVMERHWSRAVRSVVGVLAKRPLESIMGSCESDA